MELKKPAGKINSQSVIGKEAPWYRTGGHNAHAAHKMSVLTKSGCPNAGPHLRAQILRRKSAPEPIFARQTQNPAEMTFGRWFGFQLRTSLVSLGCAGNGILRQDIHYPFNPLNPPHSSTKFPSSLSLSPPTSPPPFPFHLLQSAGSIRTTVLKKKPL